MADTSENASSPLPLPDIGDIIFLLILQLLLFSLPNYVFGDGSTGWHVSTGRQIVEKMSIPRVDFLSYTFPGAPWVSYEWLADILMFLPVKFASLNGLALATSAAISLLFLLLYKRCRQAHCHFAVVVVLILLGALASSVSWLARPHIFTFFAVFIFAGVLESHRRGTTSGARLTVVLSLVAALWANLHPAFPVGFAMIGIYLLSNLAYLAMFFRREGLDDVKRRIRWLGIALAGTIAATLINPYGPNLWLYIASYLKGMRVLAHTDEYASPVFHGAIQPASFEILLLLFASGLFLSKVRPSLAQFLTCAVFASMGLSSVRHIPLFVIVALPVIAEMFANARLSRAEQAAAPESAGWWQRLKASWSEMGQTVDEMESRCRLHILPAAAVVVLGVAALNHGSLMGASLLASGFDPEKFPTRALECIKAHNLKPEAGFNMDNWGGYINYELGIPVFIDDRADFYGEGFYLEYGTVSTVAPGWREVLDRYKIEWILFPANSRLVATLNQDPGWKPLCEDQAASLFVRAPKK